MATAAGYPRKSDKPIIYGYKTDTILGTGGTGTVYRALDPKTGEVYALKLFHQNFFRSAFHRRDVAKAANRSRKLDHPNVVKIKEFISGDEGEVLVLEYVDGPDLKWYIANRPYNLQERLVIMAQICNGLGYLHEQGVTHHDLKPANVLFTRKGQVKLCDFSLYGSSLLLRMFDSSFGDQITPMYVAPEIVKKQRATTLSDMYSLGVVMYLVFTGHLPFEVDNLQKLYMCHVHTPPIHPCDVDDKVPRSLGDIIMKLLSKKPKDRYQNCDQVRIAMADIGKSRI